MVERRREGEVLLGRRRFLEAGLGAVAAIPFAGAACGDGAGDPGDPGGGTVDGGGDGAALDGGEDAEAPVAWDPDAVPEDALAFPLGVQAGVVRGESAVLWAATALPAARLRAWRDAGPGEVFLDVDLDLTPADGFLRGDVSGLEPGALYRYAFLAPDLSTRSAAGTFRAALAPGDRRPLTIAATACTHWAHMPYPALLETAEHDFDLFCQLGDMGYFDGAVTKDEYRALWRTTLDAAGYRAVLAKAPHYATLDDHELVNSDEWETTGPERREAAFAAWYEAVPLPNPETRRVWDRFRWGDTLEVFVLDCRTERDYATFGTADPIYVSKAQMAWLKAGLLESPCHFKVVLNSVPITAYPEPWPETADRWQGWPEQREELLGFLASNEVRNVWFLSGDLHHGQVARVDPLVPERRRYWEICVGPGGPSFLNPLPNLVARDPSLAPDFAPEDQFLYLAARRAATLLTFDPDKDAVRCLFLDPDDGSTHFDRWVSEDGPLG